jgi:hypothetical protein
MVVPRPLQQPVDLSTLWTPAWCFDQPGP